MKYKSINAPEFFEELIDSEIGVSEIIEQMLQNDPEAVRDMLFDRYRDNDLYGAIKNAVVEIAERRMGY